MRLGSPTRLSSLSSFVVCTHLNPSTKSPSPTSMLPSGAALTQLRSCKSWRFGRSGKTSMASTASTFNCWRSEWWQVWYKSCSQGIPHHTRLVEEAKSLMGASLDAPCSQVLLLWICLLHNPFLGLRCYHLCCAPFSLSCLRLAPDSFCITQCAEKFHPHRHGFLHA